MREAEHRVVLVDDTGPNVRVHLSAWTDEQGLVLEGQDLGPVVESIWGDTDYEYWLSVERKDLDRVMTHLAGELDEELHLPEGKGDKDRKLLDLIELAWRRGVFTTDADFRNWLESIGVPSKFENYV